MKLFRSLPLLAFALLLLGADRAWAKPGPVRNGSVSVELIAQNASIQPGHPFLVAVRMKHDEHWHSYWTNAGTGYPTAVTWTLPDGFTAGPMQWTTPHVVRDTSGKITGNGYEGEVLHFFQITPPASLAAGSDVTLKALVEWLMCQDVCMPGDANVELTLPVKSDDPAANSAVAPVFKDNLEKLPENPDGNWTVSATRDGKKVTLFVKAKGSTNHTPKDLHFFSEDALIDYSLDQTAKAKDGGYLMELTVGDEAPSDVTRLTGILASSNGWKDGSGYDGLAIDVPFGAQQAADSAPAPKAEPVATASSGGGTPPASTGGGPTTPAGGGGSLAGTVLLAFLGGLVLNLMPCVFPVLGIKILGFVNQSGSDRGKVTMHGVMFTIGVLLSFWALAGLLIGLRAGGAQLGWGFQLQSPVFVFGMAVFLLVFALNMSGLFEIGLSATGAGASLQSKHGYAGSFFTGMLATLVATPCSAPFLAPALGAALTLSPVESIIVFTAIAVGLSAPYLFLSIFPQAIRLLPRPGAWMETFKQFMAFPLYATVGWLLWVLAGQTKDDDYALLMIAFGFVLVAMAAWAYGRFGQAHGKPARQRFGYAFAALLLVAGLWIGWPQTGRAEPARPGAYVVDWKPWSPEAVAAAQASGKYVYVDFTARWCATCQTNKATVFHSDDVLQAFNQKDVILFRADWTNRDPRITQELAKWNRSAVPFNLIYSPSRKDPVILPELLTPGKVLDALAEASRQS